MSIGTLYGKRIQIAPRHPKMQVSDTFARIQSPELVASTNAWMAQFFGYVETVPDGQVYELVQQNTLVMNEQTYERLRAAVRHNIEGNKTK